MSGYIDGFVLPVPRERLETYQEVAGKIAEVWKEHGALSYSECVIDDPHLEGTRSFVDAASAKENEVVVFGWVTFESREARDLANQRVPEDPRMAELVRPLCQQPEPIFDAARMVYGGFRRLV